MEPTPSSLLQQSQDATPADLLALYDRIVDELCSRRVVRSSNNPVGDYGEYLTARAFGLTLVANLAIGYDAVSAESVRYQVKTRRLTLHNRSPQLGSIRGLAQNNDPFDFLVGILFEADFAVQRAALVPVAVVRAKAERDDYVKAWQFILRDSVWATAGVEDVTERIRAAAEADPLPRPGTAVVGAGGPWL